MLPSYQKGEKEESMMGEAVCAEKRRRWFSMGKWKGGDSMEVYRGIGGSVWVVQCGRSVCMVMHRAKHNRHRWKCKTARTKQIQKQTTT